MPAKTLLLFALLFAMLLAPACSSDKQAEEAPVSNEAERMIEDMDAAAQATIEPGSQQAGDFAARLLTPADVEKVTGMSGLKVVPKDPSAGAGGDTNIASPDGQLIVMLSVGDGDFYDLTKSGPNFGRDHSGIGDRSYVGPAKDLSAEEYLLGVESGSWGIVLASFFGPESDAAPYLSIDQLEELAAIAISRL